MMPQYIGKGRERAYSNDSSFRCRPNRKSGVWLVKSSKMPRNQGFLGRFDRAGWTAYDARAGKTARIGGVRRGV